MTFMPTTPTLLWAFIVTSLVLAITPGPGVLFIIARSAMHGRRSALASVAGVAAGNFVNAAFAALGLAALFAVSSLAYEAVKWAGAGYLVFLGIRTLMTARELPNLDHPHVDTARRILRDGFIVSLLNPKTTVFFAAFLPQFLPHGSVDALHILALGAIFVLIAACTDSIYALGSTMITRSMSFPDRMLTGGRVASGVIFIGLGCATVLAGQRA